MLAYKWLEPKRTPYHVLFLGRPSCLFFPFFEKYAQAKMEESDHSIAATEYRDNEEEEELLIPPLNFAMVAPGVYRSGYPNKRNFTFMKKLGLKNIMYVNLRGTVC